MSNSESQFENWLQWARLCWWHGTGAYADGDWKWTACALQNIPTAFL